MNRPAITVCIPVYNLEDYVGEALESVRQQTFTGFDVIIVDDGSTDSTAERVSPFLEDKRFNYVYQENGGVGKARNRALDLACGEWIALLDADDIWMPDKLLHQWSIIREDQTANLIYSDMTIFWDDGRLPDRRYFEKIEMLEGDITAWLYEKNHVPSSTVMIKTEDLRAIGGFDEGLRYCEDGDAWLRLAQAGIRARACREALTRHRLRSGSLSQSREQMLCTAISLKQNLLKRENRPALAGILRRSIRMLRASLALEHMRQAARADSPEFEGHLLEWWRCEPRRIKRLARAIQCYASRATRLDLGRAAYMRSIGEHGDRKSC